MLRSPLPITGGPLASLRAAVTALTAAALSAAAATAGCAYRAPTPHLPSLLAGSAAGPAHVQVDEVSVVAARGALDSETVALVGEEAVACLRDAARTSRWGDGPTSVRVHVQLGPYVNDLDRALQQDGMAILGMYALPAGMVYEEQTLEVDLTVERDGHTWAGHGAAHRGGSIYAHARRRALAAAIDRALADAAARP